MYKVTKHVIIYFLSAVFRQKEHTLFTLMHYYNIIMNVIYLIHIITWIVVSQSACGKSRQNGKTKSAHGVVKPTCTHLGCHVGEDFPCKNLLVGSMTWTWSSWDQHRVYRWNCGVGDGSPCQPETQNHHHSTRI